MATRARSALSLVAALIVASTAATTGGGPAMSPASAATARDVSSPGGVSTRQAGSSAAAAVVAGPLDVAVPIDSAVPLDTGAAVQSVDGATATPATQVQAGDVIVYAITIANRGGEARATDLRDVVPAHTTYSGVGEGWSCAQGAQSDATCTQRVVVAAAASVSRTFTVTVVTLPVGWPDVSNQVTSSVGACHDCLVANPTVAVLDTVQTIVSVNEAPATTDSALKGGDVVVYRIVTTNTGGSAASTVLSQPVPTDTHYTGSGQGWTCVAGAVAPAACIQSITVSANESVSKLYTVTIDPLDVAATQITSVVSTASGTCSACSVVNPTVPLPVPCSAGSVLTLSASGGVYRTDTTTGVDTAVAHFTGVSEQMNGLAVAAGGTDVYAVNQISTPTTVFRYDLSTRTSSTYPATKPSVQPVGGGLDPTTGIYYYGGFRGGKTLVVWGFDTRTNTAIPGLLLTATISGETGSGDLAFDSLGNLYFASNQYLYRVPGPIPATSTGLTLAATRISALSAKFNGITFVASGDLIINSAGPNVVSVVNPNTGELISSVAHSVKAASQTMVDMASCSYNGTLTLQANIASRVAPTDQFRLSIATSPASPLLNKTGVTVGADTGRQSTAAETAGPVIGLEGAVYTITETMTSGEPAKYRTTFECLNELDGTVMATGSGTTAVLTGFPAAVGDVGALESCVFTNAPIVDLISATAIATVNDAPATSATVIKAGDVIGYRITTTNRGPAAGATELLDPVPANTDYSGIGEGWTCVGPTAGQPCAQTVNVAAGASVVTPYTVTALAILPPGTLSIANVVTSQSGGCTDCTASNPTEPGLDAVTRISTVNGVAATPETALEAGDVVVYRIGVANRGGTAGTTVLTEVVPLATSYAGGPIEGWSCRAPAVAGTPCGQSVTVAVGATSTLSFTVTVQTLPTGPPTIDNTLTSAVGRCSACSATNPTGAILDTVKTVLTVNTRPAGPATIVDVGDVVTYQLSVTNTGGSAGRTVLTDVVPANTQYAGTGEGWSCSVRAIAATRCAQTVPVGSRAATLVRYTVFVDTIPSGPATIVNRATTSGGTCSACTASNPTHAPAPAISLATAGSPSTISGVAATIAYSFLVINTGNVTLHGISIVDGFVDPAGPVPSITCPVTALEPAGATTCTSSYTANQFDIDNGAVVNVTRAMGTPPTGPAITSVPTLEKVTVALVPALTLVTSARPASVTAAGQHITYSFLATNTGNQTMYGIHLNATLSAPAGPALVATCPVRPLLPATSTTCTATYTVTPVDIDHGAVVITATAIGVPPTGPMIRSPVSVVTVDSSRGPR